MSSLTCTVTFYSKIKDHCMILIYLALKFANKVSGVVVLQFTRENEIQQLKDTNSSLQSLYVLYLKLCRSLHKLCSHQENES